MKVITTSTFIFIFIIGSISHFLLSNSFSPIERQHATVIVEGEVAYPYYLPIKKGRTVRDAMYDFGLLPTSDLDDLYIKVSRSWEEIGGDYVIEEDTRFKVGKK